MLELWLHSAQCESSPFKKLVVRFGAWRHGSVRRQAFALMEETRMSIPAGVQKMTARLRHEITARAASQTPTCTLPKPDRL